MNHPTPQRIGDVVMAIGTPFGWGKGGAVHQWVSVSGHWR